MLTLISFLHGDYDSYSSINSRRKFEYDIIRGVHNTHAPSRRDKEEKKKVAIESHRRFSEAR